MPGVRSIGLVIMPVDIGKFIPGVSGACTAFVNVETVEAPAILSFSCRQAAYGRYDNGTASADSILGRCCC